MAALGERFGARRADENCESLKTAQKVARRKLRDGLLGYDYSVGELR